MKQLPLFPAPPRPPVKPVAKRRPSASDSWTRVHLRTTKCDDCVAILILAKGRAPVARMANWKYRPGGSSEVLALCHAHKQQRVDDIEGRRR
jgi:hypothetical protein